MRIALISDIHANREAFEACLDHARRNAVDEYVFLGDYVGYGADPGWVVDSVRKFVERGAIAVLGNHDAAAVGVPAEMNEDAASAIEWTRAKLSPAQTKFLGPEPPCRLLDRLGQPRDHNPAACYAVLDDTRDVLTYIRVPYDIDAAAKKIRDAGLPIGLSYRLYQGY